MVSTKLTSKTVVSVFEVQGADPEPLQYRSSSIIPTRAEVTVKDGRSVSVKVSGPRAKKDGSPGTESSDNSYYGWGDPTPGWVVELAEACERSFRAGN